MRKETFSTIEKFKEAKQRQMKRYYKKTQNAPNQRKQWTIKETNMVLAHEIPDTELSKKIGRSVGAIQAQRSILKKAESKNKVLT